jgi:hypothetical protein
LSKTTVDQVNSTPAADRPKMFEMMKMKIGAENWSS